MLTLSVILRRCSKNGLLAKIRPQSTDLLKKKKNALQRKPTYCSCLNLFWMFQNDGKASESPEKQGIQQRRNYRTHDDAGSSSGSSSEEEEPKCEIIPSFVWLHYSSDTHSLYNAVWFVLGTQPRNNNIIPRVFFTAVIVVTKNVHIVLWFMLGTQPCWVASKKCWGSFTVNLDGCHNTDEILVRAYFFTELLAKLKSGGSSCIWLA